MPRISDLIPINNPKLDKRVKLLPRHKSLIVKLSKSFSTRQLAYLFNVSRRTIQFIIDPNKLKENIKRRHERGGSKKYYLKEKQAVAMKKHRNYKSTLYKNGKLQKKS